MEQYLALSRENQAPGMVKPEIRGNVNFEIKSQFMRELREETFSGTKNEDAHDHVERVLNIVSLFNIPGVSQDAILLRVFSFTLTGTVKRSLSSSSNTDGLAAIVKETKYGEFGRPVPFNGNNEAKYHVGPPGYYTRTDNQTPSREKRPDVKTLTADVETKATILKGCKAIFAKDGTPLYTPFYYYPEEINDEFEDPDGCGECMENKIFENLINKLHNEWFKGTDKDDEDLEGIIDYLEPTLYDGFIDSDDEEYKERKYILLEMPYIKPPPILIEKGVEELSRTKGNITTIRAEIMNEILKNDDMEESYDAT
nr:hypothetical protein [Tanacetum cinerariifolium]